MNYIELINKFWLTSEAHSFRTTDIALYFYFLRINNACSWKEYFKRKNIQIQADLDISYNTLKDARNRLKQANLLDFKSKNGSGDVLYTLSKFDKVSDEVADEVVFCKSTSSKNDEVSSEVANEVTNEVANEVTNEVDLTHINGTCNQTKLNKTKGSPPQSPAGGNGGKSFLNLIETTPPNDGVKRNWNSLKQFLSDFKITGNDADEIIILSNYGETNQDPAPPLPFWEARKEVLAAKKRYTNGTGKELFAPGKFILSRLKNKQ